MPQKPVEIAMKTRDVDGNINGETNVPGYTEDDGATIVVGAGYLPGIENSQPGEIVITVTNYAISPKVFVSRSINEENGDQIIVLADPA